MSTPIVVPAVLAETLSEFKQQLEAVVPFTKRVHIDIADGIFVETKTVQVENIAVFFAQHAQQYQNISFDFHLMVNDWQGAAFELGDLEEYIHINLILPHYSVFEPEQTFPYQLGITFNPDEEIDTSILDDFAAIQIMTVTPGKQGGVFLPDNLKKIKSLRTTDYSGEILVDGGVNSSTIPIFFKESAVPDIFCVGSYLTRANNPHQHYEELQKLITQRGADTQ